MHMQKERIDIVVSNTGEKPANRVRRQCSMSRGRPQVVIRGAENRDETTNTQREGKMRIWSLHPKYLDAKGLVALWREALLALKVLQGGTRGYRNHPQLQRFREQLDPVRAVALYLREVRQEALARGYRFDAEKIPDVAAHPEPIPVASGQVEYEWEHLLRKLARRDPDRAVRHAAVMTPEVHPLFRIVPGPMAGWERP